MELLSSVLSWRHVAAVIVAYVTSLVLYRLFLHPLARFPGPKLAAITRWYEAYYDVIQNGQYTFKIGQMHGKYGPIVRISPHELHVNDLTYFETLYRQDGRWDKYDWAVDAFAAKGATIFTPDHAVHRARRQPMSSFFSKAKVASRQDMIRRHVEKLCGRVARIASSRGKINLGAAITAIARDIANEFILGKSYNSLDKDDFDISILNAGLGSGNIWRISKHIRWVSHTLMAMPTSWILRVADTDTKTFYLHVQETMKDTEKLMEEAASFTPGDKAHRTIVHDILDSKLPPSEKSLHRVFEDASTVTGAGFETTAGVLRMTIFHVFSKPEILRRLRDELTSVNVSNLVALDLKTLEQLPYLTSALMEGLRLSPAVATRMARVAQDRELTYGDWKIPPGTAVGMTAILIHTNKELYPEPRRFNPDRWMDPESRKMVDKTFIPFSKGTRMCLGLHLAWAELYLIVATLVQRFDFQFEGVTGEDFECTSDQFIIGNNIKGMLHAIATIHEG
ncbi:cytochrome P450 [Hypoxylon sp. NC1633]|nr:cytochrome P450 [Hypoxylon sp. NC1633]